MSKLIQAVYFTILLAFSLPGAAETAIKEGKWSMSITTKVVGMEDQMAEAQAAMANMSAEEKAMVQKMTGAIQSESKNGPATIDISGKYVGPCEK